MKVILFNQWDKLSSLIKDSALLAANEKTSYEIKNLKIEENVVSLYDRAMNNLALSGEAVTVKVPDIIPGKARDFLLRVEASLDTEIKFSGAEAFEGDHPDVFISLQKRKQMYFLSLGVRLCQLMHKRKVKRNAD